MAHPPPLPGRIPLVIATACASPTRLLGLVLAASGAALLVAVALHPMLPLTGPGDLDLIVHTARWHPVHVVLLFATAGIAIGSWAPALAVGESDRPLALAASACVALGQLLNGVNIAFMLGAAPEFARAYAAGQVDLAATYQAGHLAVVMVGRLGAVVASAGAGLWGWCLPAAAIQTPFLRSLARVAAVAGVAGACLARPGHPLMLTGIGLVAAWGTGIGGRIWKGS
jgi:hypothetical protein